MDSDLSTFSDRVEEMHLDETETQHGIEVADCHKHHVIYLQTAGYTHNLEFQLETAATR